MQQMTLDPLYENVRQHILEKYSGIFTAEHMERHFRDYVCLDLAKEQLQQIQDLTMIQPDQKLLDIGCGYGSFVLVCRNEGILAEGIDIAEYDIGFARNRWQIEKHAEPAESIYHLGDGQNTGLSPEQFDVVTAWNLLEHVPDFRQLINEAFRLLRPGGYFIGIAPNYLAFRQEAHYHIQWLPLFPRKLAHDYLLRKGLNPDFFDNDIHYVTSWGIQDALKQCGFVTLYPENIKFDHPERIHSSSLQSKFEILQNLKLVWLVKIFFQLLYWNPFKPVVYFIVKKPDR
jgi:MPBQ/MSBQ methyltransferase